MRTTLDFADVTITIDAKEAAADATPLTTLQVSDLIEACDRSRALLSEQTKTIEQQAAIITRLLEERRAVAAALAVVSAQS